MKQAGYNVVVESLSGVFLPAKTPEAIVGALSTAMRKATQSQTMIDSLAKFGTEPAFLAPAEFSAWIKAEIARWGPVVQASGFVAID
jgi:tripartite-type tricarboxylate transporter receptor subunit TctC